MANHNPKGSTLNTQQALSLALQHHQAGRLDQAADIYQRILAADPNHTPTLNLLGILESIRGNKPRALELLRRASAAEPNNPNYHNNLGITLRAMGQHDQAADAYQEALRLNPNYAEAYNGLGNVFKEQNKPTEALVVYQIAVKLKPDYAEGHNNLANMLKDQGHLQQAMEEYRLALKYRPNAPPVHQNLGIVLQQVGQSEQAAEEFRTAIKLKPDYAEAHNMLGVVLAAGGDYAAALQSYQKALEYKPDYAETHNNLGNLYRDRQQVQEAIAQYQLAIGYKPDLAEAHNNLGNMLRQRQQFPEAIAEYRLAIGFNPNLLDAYNHLGSALRSAGQFDQAIETYRQAIQIKPTDYEMYYSLGDGYYDAGKLAQAADAYRAALKLKPDYAEVHCQLGNVLNSMGAFDEAVLSYRMALKLKPDFAEAHCRLCNGYKDQGRLDEMIQAYHEALKSHPDSKDIYSNLAYALYFLPDYDAAEIHEAQKKWNDRFAAPLKEYFQPHENDRDPERKLRIGFVSPDFYDHCQSFFTIPLLSHLNREQWEIYCYSNVLKPDAVTDRIRGHADAWRTITDVKDQDAAEMIRDDKIDILVDLTLHMALNRLLVFAYKPAPVQVTWLGYPGSTGLETMDYRLSDPYLDPPGTDLSVYSEQTLRLPETFWCYDPQTEEPPANDPSAAKNGFVTFGCLNNFAKVNARVPELWGKVMAACADSRLILLAPTGSARQRFLDQLKKHGIDPARVEFVDRMSRTDYLKLHQRIDIALDPFPCNGHTTSMDAIWMGVPVVTLTGNTAISRGGRSILSNIGVPELIAETPEEYVNIATKLAGDLPRLAELRRTLRGRMEASPLMDAKRFARNIEAAYREMWRKWCAKT